MLSVGAFVFSVGTDADPVRSYSRKITKGFVLSVGGATNKYANAKRIWTGKDLMI